MADSKIQQETAEQDHARVKFPPPLWFLLMILAALGLEWLLPSTLAIPGPTLIIGVVLAALGLLLIILIAGSFKRFATAIEPWKPTSALITTGIYAWSRNPIYLGFCLINFGLGLAADSLWLCLSFIPGLIGVYYIAVAKEEAYLERRFGEEYLEYKRRVRRWF